MKRHAATRPEWLPGFGDASSGRSSGPLKAPVPLSAPLRLVVDTVPSFTPRLKEQDLSDPEQLPVIKERLKRFFPTRAAEIERYETWPTHPDLWKEEGLLLQVLDWAKERHDDKRVRQARLDVYTVSCRQSGIVRVAGILAEQEEVRRSLQRLIEAESPPPSSIDPEDREIREALFRKRETREQQMKEIYKMIDASQPWGDQAERIVSWMEEIYEEAHRTVETRLYLSQVVHATAFDDLLNSVRSGTHGHVPQKIAEAIRLVERLRLVRDRLYFLRLAA
jgi:hypothetical protein